MERNINFYILYLFIGLIIFFIDLLVFYFVNNFSSYLIAQVVSWLSSCFIGIYLFRKYVYKSKLFFFKLSIQIYQSLLLLFVLFFSSIYILYLFVEILNINVYLSKLSIVLMTVIANFFIRTFIIYK